MKYTEEEKILIRAITWMSEDANEGCEEAKEIIAGLEKLVKLFAIPVVMPSAIDKIQDIANGAPEINFNNYTTDDVLAVDNALTAIYDICHDVKNNIPH